MNLIENIEVLSIIASQLIVLFSAIDTGIDKIILEKNSYSYFTNILCFYCNESSYEGHTALPVNLVPYLVLWL